MHGLRPGDANDLAGEPILIDRFLKNVVDAEDIDVHARPRPLQA